MNTSRVLIIAVCILGACSGGGAGGATSPTDPTPTPDPVASVTIAAPPSDFFVDQSVHLIADARDVKGTVVLGRPIAWSSSLPEIATITPDGVVTGVAEGRTVISATSEGRSATIDLAVVARNTRLLVAFAGVPSGVFGVSLVGRNSANVVFISTQISTKGFSLTGTPPGDYTLTPGPARVVLNGLDYLYLPPAAEEVRAITLRQFQTTNVLVSYVQRTGAITISATGLPAGTPTACQLTFPAPGIGGVLGGSASTPSMITKTVQAFGTGTGTLTCDSVTVGGVVYRPTPAQQTVTVPATLTPATASVDYK